MNTPKRTSDKVRKLARIYLDESDSSIKAFKLLRKKGFIVISLPISGKIGPKIRIGEETYQGLKQIRAALKSC